MVDETTRLTGYGKTMDQQIGESTWGQLTWGCVAKLISGCNTNAEWSYKKMGNPEKQNPWLINAFGGIPSILWVTSPNPGFPMCKTA